MFERVLACSNTSCVGITLTRQQVLQRSNFMIMSVPGASNSQKKKRRFGFLSVLGVLFFLRFLACFCGRLLDFCGRFRVFAVAFLSFLICGRLRPKLGKHQNCQKFLAVGSSRYFFFSSWRICTNRNDIPKFTQKHASGTATSWNYCQ